MLTESKLRILAALVEARGDVPRAARLAGVSKQYVYEVLGGLRKAGVKLRGYPYLSPLGRVFIALSSHPPPNDGLLAFRLKIYRFNGDSLAAGVYLVPHTLRGALVDVKLPGAVVEELLDVYTVAPKYDISELRPQQNALLPSPPRMELDEDDVAILRSLYDDIFAHVTESVPSASRSKLSYHYRNHVKKILQVLVDFHPEKLHERPLLFAEIRAPSEKWLAALMNARQAYLLMPKLNRLSAYALLDVDDLYSLLKRIAAAKEEGRMELQFRFIGYVDLDESWKPRLPLIIAHAGLRTA